jgi:hypothetical protein
MPTDRMARRPELRADAHDCIMVRINDPTEYKSVAWAANLCFNGMTRSSVRPVR